MKTAIMAAVGVFLLASPAAEADCNQATPAAITRVAVPGHPFSAIPSRDGCTIFVSLTGRYQSQLLVMSRSRGSIALLRRLFITGILTGMTLSPDGRFLAAATYTGVTIFDVAKLTGGAGRPIVASSNDGPHAGSIYVAFTADRHLLFVANERSASLSVYDTSDLPAHFKVIGRVGVGAAPVGLAISPDGKYLYSTSEVGPGSWPPKCTSEGPPHPEGMLLVIDIAKAGSDPAHSVLGGVPAGCNPVRVALSPDGGTLYVTARGDNELESFKAAALITNPVSARPARIPVGVSPVGVIAIGNKVIVANSDRFGGGTNETLSVLNAADPLARRSSIPAGGFPRELSVTPDQHTLLVTNFATRDLELIDLRRLEQATHWSEPR